MNIRRLVVAVAACAALLLAVPMAHAQQQTGSITGSVSDDSGAVLPGVNVTLTGDRIIGGTQSKVTDASGSYRFDRLAPGAYDVKFELQGFRTVDRPDVRISAGVRGDHQRQDGSRRPERDDHGHRRIADGGRPLERAADGHEPGNPRGRARPAATRGRWPS